MFSIVLCFFRNIVPYPNAVIGAAILIPVIVFLVIYSLPTQDSEDIEGEQVPTSWYMLKTILFTLLIFIVFITSVLACLSLKVPKITVRRIDSELTQPSTDLGAFSETKGYIKPK